MPAPIVPLAANPAPAIVAVAEALQPDLAQGLRIDALRLRREMEHAFGGSDATGAWDWKLAYEAGEVALVLFLRKFGRALFVLTGGDPLHRPDIFGIIRHGAEMGLRMTMTPSGTPLLTKEKVRRMKDEGMSHLAVSLDGDTREFHDGFRGVGGSFQWTMNYIRWAREIDLEVQVNTTVTRFKQDRVRDISEILVK